MAGFHEVQFPPIISMGAVGGPGFHTTILTLASGFERRNVDWSKTRAKYTISFGAKSKQDMNVAIKFFFARLGRAFGFRFKDWSDFQVPTWEVTPGDIDPLPTFFTTTGVLATFQLTKTYGDTASTFTRAITKPVAATLSLFNNGAPMVVTTDYTLDATTGIVTLSAGVTATTGHLITGSFEFDVPVRFDVDDMAIQAMTQHLMEWDNIQFIEVRV